MKTTVFFATALALLPFASAADGQAVTGTQQTTTTTTAVAVPAAPAADAFVMSAGSVLALRGKESSRLTADMKLADGSIITPGGTVRRADGTSVTLADGQAITVNGNISNAPAGAVTDTNTIVTGTAVKVQ